MARTSLRKRGFTLVELAIVMGVIGGVVSAIFYASSVAHEMQKESAAYIELQTVSTNFLNVLQGQPVQQCSGSDTLAPCLITSQVIPAEYVDPADGTQGASPWNPGGGLAVWRIPPGKLFRVAFYGVSRPGCVALLTQGTSCEVGQMGCPFDVVLAANGGNITSPGTNGWSQTLTASAISGLCDENSYTGGANSVEFDYTP